MFFFSPGNAQSFAIKYQGISQKAKRYEPDETIYENTQPFRQQFQQQMNNQYEDDDHTYDCPENQPVCHLIFWQVTQSMFTVLQNNVLN